MTFQDKVRAALNNQPLQDVEEPAEVEAAKGAIKAPKQYIRLPLKPSGKVKIKEAFIFSPNSQQGLHTEKLDPDKIPPGIQPFYIEWVGRWMPILVQRDNDVYEAFSPKDNIDQLPEKLSRAIKMPAHRALWAMTKNPMEKLAIVAVVVVLVAGMILMFALATSKPKTPTISQAPIQTSMQFEGGKIL